jgi:hypothetical protein
VYGECYPPFDVAAFAESVDAALAPVPVDEIYNITVSDVEATDVINANYTFADDPEAWGVSEDLLSMTDEEWAATMLLNTTSNDTDGAAWDWNSTWPASMYLTDGTYDTSLATNISYTCCSAPNRECVNAMDVSEATQLYDAVTGVGCSMTSDFWLTWALKPLAEGDGILRAPANGSGYYSQSTAPVTPPSTDAPVDSSSGSGSDQTQPPTSSTVDATAPSSGAPAIATSVTGGAGITAVTPVQTVQPSPALDPTLQATTIGGSQNVPPSPMVNAASQTNTMAPASPSPKPLSSSPAVQEGMPEAVPSDTPQVTTYTVTTGISLAGKHLTH